VLTVNTCSAQQVKLDGNSQLVFYYLLCRISSHARNAQMRAIATVQNDVARSVKLRDLCHCLGLCLFGCWSHRFAVQKRLNQSRCRSWGLLVLVQRTMY